MTANEIKEARAKLIANARVIIDGAEGRELTAEENTQVDAMFADADKLAEQAASAERKEKLANAEAELRATTGRRTQPNTLTKTEQLTDSDRKNVIRAWALNGTDRGIRSADVMYKAEQFGVNLASRNLSVRALSKGTTTAGGHMVPTLLSNELEKQLKFYCPIRNYARVITTDTGASLDWPRVSDATSGTFHTASIIGEAGSINTNVDPSFDKVTLGAYKFATTIVQVSVELLQDSSIDVESLLADLLAERMGRGQGAYFATGTGSSQPQGYVTAASAVANLASGSTMVADKLIDLVHGCDVAYRTNGVFFAHDTTIANIRKLKSNDNQYLWQPGLVDGQPDRVLGYPIVADNNMATSGDNAKLLVFGNPKHFVIRDVGSSLSLVRLDELYAASGTVGFLLMQRADSKLVGHSGSLVSLNAEDTA